MSARSFDVEPHRSSGDVRNLILLIPLVFFLGLTVVFAWGLTIDPSRLPSTLIGKRVPEFKLPAVQGRQLGLSNADLVGEVSLVNVFASWCTACRQEHPLLMQLAKEHQVAIHGLNYKDQPGNAAAWLDELGDPYTRTGADLSGRVAIDWGVYGVPETYVISDDGTIAYKHIGPVTEQDLRKAILPLIAKLREKTRASE